MGRRKRRTFSKEFKAEAVRQCLEGDRSIWQVAIDLDLTESALRRWVEKHEAEQGQEADPGGPLTTAEREELRSLRRRVRRLEQEREILKKATAFFAKENE